MGEIATRNPQQELVAQVRGDVFKEQIAMALPENVPASRFVRATVTSLLANPDLANLEHNSLFVALLRSAQDGLLPDGREAAIVGYGQKAQYLPMIGGIRKIAGEHGWTIDTKVVREHDEFAFEYGIEPRLTHRPATGDRGDLVYAYAVARHRDGRREVEVMGAEDVEKVRKASRASSRGPWVDWPERMWEKTVGHRIFKRLPLDPGDKRVASIIDAAELPAGEAAAMLYGPGGQSFEAYEIGGGTEGTGGASTGPDAAVDASAAEAASSPANQQADGGDAAAVPAAAPGAEPDLDAPAEPAFKAPAAAVTRAGKAKVPAGQQEGKTLAEILATDKGAEWIAWALGEQWPDDFRANLALFAQAKGVTA